MSRTYKQFDICPVVCPAGDCYNIMVPVPAPVLMSVFVNGTEYTNDANGVKVSSCYVQRFCVPCSVLNQAKCYTVKYEIIYREAYCSRKEPAICKTFRYFPIEKTNDINIFHLSDVHGRKRAAIKAGSFFGSALDLLVLNGDISSSTQTVKESLLPLQIAYEISKGEKPCVITRGNHDLRGRYADRLGEFYPLYNNRFYYTAELGPLWFMVLDCGEDKNDDHIEYAGTVAFHKYRQTETVFIRNVINTGGVPDNKYRIVISHIPFMHTDYDPKKGVHEFDIEQDTYGTWVSLLNQFVKPAFGLFGHVHRTGVYTQNGPCNQKGFSAPMIFGGRPFGKHVCGCAITIRNKEAEVTFCDSNQTPTETTVIPLN